MKRNIRLLASVGFAAFLLLSAPALLAASAPSMGAASTFSVLAGLSMSAAAAGTTVSGDLGLSPGLAVSKTGPWTVGGSQYFGPSSLAFNAQGAALAAFNNLAGQPSDGTWAVSPWSPVPGVWTVALDTTFTGTITLTGTATDVWVFQVGRDMTFSGSVVLAGTAQACNVFWQIGRSATIASGSHLEGTLIASSDVTLVSGATVNGQIISLNGSLTTDGNTISGPTCLGGGGGAPAPAGLTCVAVLTASGAPGTETVTLSAPAPAGGTVVTLTSSAPGRASVPVSVTVPAGFTSITFTVTPGATPGSVTITATTSGGSAICTFFVAAAGAAPAAGGPTLDSVGLAILLVLLAVAGLFAVHRFSS